MSESLQRIFVTAACAEIIGTNKSCSESNLLIPSVCYILYSFFFCEFKCHFVFASQIQPLIRGYVCRRREAIRRQSAICCQSFYRMYKRKQAYRVLQKQRIAAQSIQRFWRFKILSIKNKQAYEKYFRECNVAALKVK